MAGWIHFLDALPSQLPPTNFLGAFDPLLSCWVCAVRPHFSKLPAKIPHQMNIQSNVCSQASQSDGGSAAPGQCETNIGDEGARISVRHLGNSHTYVYNHIDFACGRALYYHTGTRISVQHWKNLHDSRDGHLQIIWIALYVSTRTSTTFGFKNQAIETHRLTGLGPVMLLNSVSLKNTKICVLIFCAWY